MKSTRRGESWLMHAPGAVLGAGHAITEEPTEFLSFILRDEFGNLARRTYICGLSVLGEEAKEYAGRAADIGVEPHEQNRVGPGLERRAEVDSRRIRFEHAGDIGRVLAKANELEAESDGNHTQERES